MSSTSNQNQPRDVGTIETGTKYDVNGVPPRPPIRVLLVDDDTEGNHDFVRECNRHGLAVTVACTLEYARSVLREDLVRIDVVVLATHLSGGRGESLLADIEGRSRQPSVIMTGALFPELRTGELQFRPVTVPKPISASALLRIVENVVGGYALPAITRFAARFGLSRRETQATLLLAHGLRAKAIASEMCCSEKTVYAHLFRVCKKVDCSDSHEVVCKLLAFTCHALGHTPPDHEAFVDSHGAGRGRSSAARFR